MGLQWDDTPRYWCRYHDENEWYALHPPVHEDTLSLKDLWALYEQDPERRAIILTMEEPDVVQEDEV